MGEIITLTIKHSFNGAEDAIHPVILLDDHEMVLVDCGYTGFLPEIESAFQAQGLSCDNLTTILITHHDYDHMGAMAAFKQKYPAVQVIAGSMEAPFITGRRKSLRLEQAESIQAALPDEQKAFGLAFCDMLRQVTPSPVDICVNDGDCFDWCGGCIIVGTLGHTPGHISLYLEKHKTVITGDAAVLQNNQLEIANPQFTMNLRDAEESLHKLIHLDADTYICYHGGIYRRNE